MLSNEYFYHMKEPTYQCWSFAKIYIMPILFLRCSEYELIQVKKTADFTKGLAFDFHF